MFNEKEIEELKNIVNNALYNGYCCVETLEITNQIINKLGFTKEEKILINKNYGGNLL